jgi:hypothetical protein
MALLTFNDSDIRRVVNHMTAARDWSSAWGARHPPRPQVVFVHDEGLYILSNGKPPDVLAAPAPRLFAAYAKGYNPYTEDRTVVWERARAAVGGDDFSEYLDLSPAMTKVIKSGQPFLFQMRVTKSSIQMMARAVSAGYCDEDAAS